MNDMEVKKLSDQINNRILSILNSLSSNLSIGQLLMVLGIILLMKKDYLQLQQY